MRSSTTGCHCKNTVCLFLTDAQFLLQFFHCKVEFVIIYKSVSTCIIGWIYINAFHSTGIRLYQMLQRVKIVAADIHILTIYILRLAVMFQIGH